MSNNYGSEQHRPISPWGYFGYQLLFSIPLIGFIVLICFAIGASNVNVKNYARSFFIPLLIVVILVIAIAVFGGGLGVLTGILARLTGA